jgi:hypothetical protein
MQSNFRLVPTGSVIALFNFNSAVILSAFDYFFVNPLVLVVISFAKNY